MSGMDNEFWNERYGESGRLWSGNHHPQLEDQIVDIKPGYALDLACGEGADAIWLTTQGWTVTGVDFSDVAIDRARAAAAERNLDIEFVVADLETWTPARAYDLISEFYLHFEPERRAAFHQRTQTALADAGTYLCVGHHPDHVKDGHQGPPGFLLFEPDEVEQDFSELSTVFVGRVDNPSNPRHGVDTVYVGQRLGNF